MNDLSLTSSSRRSSLSQRAFTAGVFCASHLVAMMSAASATAPAPEVAILALEPGTATRGGAVVSVAFRARAHDVSAEPATGNVTTLLLWADEQVIARFSNPPSQKEGVHRFDVDLTDRPDGPVALRATAHHGNLRAGHQGSSESVTVVLDRTPPNISASVHPLPNARGWHNGDVTVTFEATDALSGVAELTPPVVVSNEGGAQEVTGTATDRAGNSASVTVIVSLDRTAPDLVGITPSDGEVVPLPDVVLTGSAVDLLSGLLDVTCNGAAAVITGSNFECGVTLTAGTNTVSVVASDAAGNTTEESLHLELAADDFDGNGDGIPDALQSHVASVRDAVGGRKVTLAARPGARLEALAALVPETRPMPPGNIALPLGLLSFRIAGLREGDDAEVSIFLPPDVGLSTYYKFGPTPDDPLPHWYDFSFDGRTGARLQAGRVVLHFVDGERGDDDLLADGVIRDDGGPAVGRCGAAEALSPGQSFRCELSVPVGHASASWGTVDALPPLLHLSHESGRWFVTGTIDDTAPLETWRVDFSLSEPGNLLEERRMVFTVGLPFTVWTQNTILRPPVAFSPGQVAAICALGLFDPNFAALCTHIPNLEALYAAKVQNTEDDNEERAALIAERVAGFDIVALQELFDEDQDEQIDEGSPNHLLTLGPDSSSGLPPKINAGIGILVREELEVLSHMGQKFDDCDGQEIDLGILSIRLDDCLANKGFTIDKVHLGGDPEHFVWVVNTHLQAGSAPLAVAARARQLRQLAETVSAATGSDHPVLFLGDFNIREPSLELDEMLRILRLDHEDDLFRVHGPSRPEDRYTVDPERSAYARNWFDGEPRQRLDFMLVRQGSVYGIAAEAMSLTDEDLEISLCEEKGWLMAPDAPASLRCYLSDHFGISAHLSLTKRPAVTIVTPENGESFLQGEEVLLSSSLRGDFLAPEYTWISDRDGVLAEGDAPVVTWRPEATGTHRVRLEVGGPSGFFGEDAVAVEVIADSDRDGLGDDDELQQGTDPSNPDTDGDGLLDGEEIQLGSSPLLSDSDHDGLSDGEEANQFSSDPTRADTDDDGLEDGAEALLGSDPTNAASVASELPPGVLIGASGGSGGAHLVILDPSAGRYGRLGRPNGGLGFGVAFDGAARLLVGGGSTLSRSAPLSGTSTEIGTFRDASGSPHSVTQLAFNPADGSLYGVENGPAPDFAPTDRLVRIDPATAELQVVGAAGSPVHALTFRPNGTLYAALAHSAGTDRLVVLDAGSGTVTREIGTMGATPVFGLAMTRDHVLYAATADDNEAGRVLAIDPLTGAGAIAASFPLPIFDLTDRPCPAPCLVVHPGSPFAAPAASSVVAGDLDLDGAPDVVTAGLDLLQTELRTHLGDGTGGFRAGVSLTLAPNGDGDLLGDRIAIGNLNSTVDTFPDVVLADTSAGLLYVLWGDGAGGLVADAGSPYGVTGVRNSLFDVAIADLTGDGLADLLAAVDRAVVVLGGDGAGSFSFARSVAGTSRTAGIATGDLDGDGLVDLAFADLAGAVAVHPSSAAPIVLTDPQRLKLPVDVAMGRLDADRHSDLVIVDLEAGVPLLVTFGDGTGNFGPLQPTAGFDTSSLSLLRLGDLTLDGIADIVGVSSSAPQSRLRVLTSGGGRELDVLGEASLGRRANGLALADVNGDGFLDVLFTSVEGLTVALSEPPF